ncbi:hypothetical protein P171DRAFT_482076 [Karstenula rhodostoma CBS 690.94]|uniref:Uncharacterized protein n=1 Tax=Karstenula rhodostoma CBS 690.94 TaxID=1392251 RepID=A0A9P4PRU4_9PLEO|nr:hypothetical protein P171DRAFT_482076 [Karstenula rhodostoma CBS 690.94]
MDSIGNRASSSLVLMACYGVNAAAAPIGDSPKGGASIGDVANLVTLVIGIPAVIVAVIGLVKVWRQRHWITANDVIEMAGSTSTGIETPPACEVDPSDISQASAQVPEINAVEKRYITIRVPKPVYQTPLTRPWEGIALRVLAVDVFNMSPMIGPSREYLGDREQTSTNGNVETKAHVRTEKLHESLELGFSDCCDV